MPKSKLSALVSLLLVFFSGTVLGAFAHRLYMVKTVLSTGNIPAPNRRPDPEEIRRRQVAEMRTRLKLDDDQLAKLNQIYDQTREQADLVHHKANDEMRAVWDAQVAKIKAILRPEQVPAYDQLRAEREAARRQHRPPGPEK